MKKKIKSNNKNTIKWINSYAKGYYLYIFAMCLCSVLSALSFVALALFSRNVTDIASGEIQGNITLQCVLLFASIVMQILLSIAGSALRARAEGRLDMTFKRHLFSGLLRKKYTCVTGYHSGELVNRLTSDVGSVVNGVISIIPNVVSIITRLVACAVTLFVISDKIAFIILGVGLLIPVFGRLISRRYKELHKQFAKNDGAVKTHMQESFENIAVIKTFPGNAAINKKLNDRLDTGFKLRLKRNALNIFAHTGIYSIFTIGYYVLLVWGAFGISGGIITYGTLLAFLQIVTQIRTPLQNVSGILPHYYAMLASAERLMELDSLPKEELPYALNRLKDFESLTVNNLWFDYGDGPIIKNASFTVKKGTVTAVRGKSGCGKSTLFKLILGLLEPTDGSIIINGSFKAGAGTRHLFSYVPQGSMILSGTIRENLTVCDDGVPEEVLDLAAKTAEIYDFIMSLPAGYDTVLGEAGAGMSEGQLQRLAIARALVCDSPVILLDESTSALDEETEYRLLCNIKALTDKTVIFITHRSKSLAFCDETVFIEDGEIQ